MSLIKKIEYQFMKDVGAGLAMKLAGAAKKKGQSQPNPHLGPRLGSSAMLQRIIARHYFLSRFAKGAMPIAWVTSGAPVELLRAFGFYTIYPENHSALCGAAKRGAALCQVAEEHGYAPELCSYARIDLGHLFSGKTPVGHLPKPDLLFCTTNICQTVGYWYKAIAHYLDIPLIQLDTPFNFTDIVQPDIDYMVAQLQEIVEDLERYTGRRFDYNEFVRIVGLSRDTSMLWGEVLDTMKTKPSPMTIFDAFTQMLPVVSLRGLPVAKNYYEALLAELRQRVREGVGALKNERKRLMWDNIAVWHKLNALSNVFAERDMNFVVATYTSSWSASQGLMDVSDPFTGIAKTYSGIILNNNLNHRLKTMQRAIADYHVDGLVIHSARSCKPYSVGQYDLKRLLLAQSNIPSVVIEADIADERVWSEEQVRTRLEAFFESLEDAPDREAA